MISEVMAAVIAKLLFDERKVVEVELRFWEDGSYFKDCKSRLCIRCTDAETLCSILIHMDVAKYTGFSFHVIDEPPPKPNAKTVNELQSLDTLLSQKDVGEVTLSDKV